MGSHLLAAPAVLAELFACRRDRSVDLFSDGSHSGPRRIPVGSRNCRRRRAGRIPGMPGASSDRPALSANETKSVARASDLSAETQRAQAEATRGRCARYMLRAGSPTIYPFRAVVYAYSPTSRYRIHERCLQPLMRLPGAWMNTSRTSSGRFVRTAGPVRMSCRTARLWDSLTRPASG